MKWPLLVGTGWGFALALLYCCVVLYGELDDANSRTRKSIALTDNWIALTKSCHQEYRDFLAYVRSDIKERAK